MTRICIFSSHRAERGLLQPLIDRLEAHPRFDVEVFSLHPGADFGVNYEGAHRHLTKIQPDLVIVPCDRLEALAAAIAAFGLNLPIIHFHAGDTGSVSADETHRHLISLMASVHLCNGPSAAKVVCDMLQAVKRPIGCVYDVGSTAMDDIKIDESLCMGTYDLVLYHPPSNDPELIKSELDEIEELINPDMVTIWCYPNRDPGSDIIVRRINNLDVDSYTELPRSQFLGLMSKCSRFIGNSSSMIYEAPAWLMPEQIVHIGDRNKHRSFDEINPGATDRIIGILEAIDGGAI